LGQAPQALEQLPEDPDLLPTKAWRGEYLATKALALACDGRRDEALAVADVASRTSTDVEVQVLAASTRAICAAQTGDADNAAALLLTAHDTGVWDPVVCALRASPVLADTLSREASARLILGKLWERSEDRALCRRAGIRVRATRSPADVLSAREAEVLGLMAQGLRNREVARALFVAESTVKVHVRHILERLGVRTRAEAVARYERLSLRGSDQGDL
jgi:ATP/maltotriose-dependent transcriptional regulator MalT